MEGIVFSDADCRQMETLGITKAQVLSQIEIFRKSSFYVRLKRPCTLQDGVTAILPDEAERYVQLQQQAARQGRFTKFVPASGAATRMFQSLLQIYYMPQFLDNDELNLKARQGVAVACDFLRFIEDLPRLPFALDLKEVVSRDGFALEGLLAQSQYRTILEYLLTDSGLNYGTLPKGLLKFHRYPTECRTAFEEHLIEAIPYIGSWKGECRIHFTVSPEHEEGFLKLFEQIRPCYEGRYSACYDICFSFQKPSTNTIAVDMDDLPFRDWSGRLHFRPGGHGALLENMNDLKQDIVYVRNVDNLPQDRFHEVVSHWKKILGGCLIDVQDTVHGLVRSLKSGVSPATADLAERYAQEKLLIHFPEDFSLWPIEERHAYLLKKLNRPVRVCGVVQNSGEPGGAPFWVEDKSGALSIQIVEKAQVDMKDPEQQQIWMSSTHFNPVDLVCGLRDFEGKPFDLRQFVDPDAVFISKKSKDGKDLKALELPGLWNGAMADWITVIVEVPRITFNPVKTVYDLLRPEHQPESR
ncbi:MAG: DUF4301 family protein [Acidobacteriota bacterium]